MGVVIMLFHDKGSLMERILSLVLFEDELSRRVPHHSEEPVIDITAYMIYALY